VNWEYIEGNWKQIKSNLRSRWAKLTDEDIEGIAGQRDDLLAKLRELYGLTVERAEAELRDWERHQEPILPAGPAK
jgi:uncharacterized protein YjbJ (UPF0337 family)